MRNISKINGVEIPNKINYTSPTGQIYDARNGLYSDGGTVKLGKNPITEATTITTNSKLFIDSLANGNKTISIKEVMSNNQYYLKPEESGATCHNIGVDNVQVTWALPTAPGTNSLTYNFYNGGFSSVVVAYFPSSVIPKNQLIFTQDKGATITFKSIGGNWIVHSYTGQWNFPK